jgi:hypothetical protein
MGSTEVVDDTKEMDELACATCARKFGRPCELAKHLCTKEMDELACATCARKFGRPCELAKHLCTPRRGDGKQSWLHRRPCTTHTVSKRRKLLAPGPAPQKPSVEAPEVPTAGAVREHAARARSSKRRLTGYMSPTPWAEEMINSPQLMENSRLWARYPEWVELMGDSPRFPQWTVYPQWVELMDNQYSRPHCAYSEWQTLRASSDFRDTYPRGDAPVDVEVIGMHRGASRTNLAAEGRFLIPPRFSGEGYWNAYWLRPVDTKMTRYRHLRVPCTKCRSSRRIAVQCPPKNAYQVLGECAGCGLPSAVRWTEIRGRDHRGWTATCEPLLALEDRRR